MLVSNVAVFRSAFAVTLLVLATKLSVLIVPSFSQQQFIEFTLKLKLELLKIFILCWYPTLLCLNQLLLFFLLALATKFSGLVIASFFSKSSLSFR